VPAGASDRRAAIHRRVDGDATAYAYPMKDLQPALVLLGLLSIVALTGMGAMWMLKLLP
jgi:hypothetical protein